MKQEYKFFLFYTPLFLLHQIGDVHVWLQISLPQPSLAASLMNLISKTSTCPPPILSTRLQAAADNGGLKSELPHCFKSTPWRCIQYSKVPTQYAALIWSHLSAEWYGTRFYCFYFKFIEESNGGQWSMWNVPSGLFAFRLDFILPSSLLMMNTVRHILMSDCLQHVSVKWQKAG